MVFLQTREGPRQKSSKFMRARALNPVMEPINEEVKEKKAEVKEKEADTISSTTLYSKFL